MGVWFQKAKVLVSVSEIIKNPEQKEKLMNVINPPPPKKVTFEKPIEDLPPSKKDVTRDLPVILHTMDSRKEDRPPFYVSLMIFDILLHNCMLDSGSSSYVMTKKVMNRLKLRPTIPYQNICTMDSREVDVVGLIQNLLVKLAKYPYIHITMDILVIDVPDKWGMLLSRKWSADLGGWIQMGWTYVTVHATEDSLIRLHREKERKHHVEDPKNPSNEYMYNTDVIRSYTCHSTFLAPIKEKIKDEKVDEIWRMNFDGAHSRSRKGVGVVITSPKGHTFNFSFRLEFEATNNVAEYEALLLGLEIAKDMGLKMLSIKGD